MFTVESKSQLAKLMANENITVVHQKVPTASFHLKTRTLTCPIWKDMSGYLYDLMMGHEVGHAIETPEKGWHDSLSSRGMKYKNFLNIVEDARIEKKIKRRYPGLRQSFVKAYKELYDKDFFGVKGIDVSKLFLIDRINLHFKCGYLLDVPFTDIEKTYVDMVEQCETFEDVERVTELLWQYSKEEQQQEQQEQNDEGEYGDSGDQSDYFDQEESDQEFEMEENDSQDGDEEESDEISNESSDESDNEPKAKEFEPKSVTDESFRKNEDKLLDESSRPYVYVNIPKPNLDNIIVPLKNRIQKFDELVENKNIIDEYFNDFKKKNEKYITLLAKEFEMRKAASKFAKRKISDTGDIDVNKIYKYKIEDTIFRKIMKIPAGKSHGLVMLLDLSASMAGYQLKSSVEQIFILTSFCKKVNIPFVVYGFRNANRTHELLINGGLDYTKPIKYFSENENDMVTTGMNLQEIVSSNCNNLTYKKAMAYAMIHADFYMRTNDKKYHIHIPANETLSYTPLNEALIASKQIIIDFKKNNNLDIVNLVIVHDGDADNKFIIHAPNGWGNNNQFNKRYFNTRSDNVVIVDEKNKKQYPAKDTNRFITAALMENIKDITGANIIGFFLFEKSRFGRTVDNYYYVETSNKTLYEMSWEQRVQFKTELRAELRKNKFIQSKTHGYQSFFLLPIDSESIIDIEQLDVDGDMTQSKINKAFMQYVGKKRNNRVLVNKFIGFIC